MANQYTKEKLKKELQRREIVWNIVNSIMAGAISFFSALIAAGQLNWKVVGISLITAALIACIRFQKFWDGEKKEYSNTTKLFNFIH